MSWLDFDSRIKVKSRFKALVCQRMDLNVAARFFNLKQIASLKIDSSQHTTTLLSFYKHKCEYQQQKKNQHKYEHEQLNKTVHKSGRWSANIENKLVSNQETAKKKAYSLYLTMTYPLC